MSNNHRSIDSSSIKAVVEEAREKVASWQFEEKLLDKADSLSPAQVAKLIDHTLLKPEATAGEIERLCAEAIEYGFASVCVNSSWTAFCREWIGDADVAVCTVVGFPLGAVSGPVKAFEAEIAARSGATELDMVLPVGQLRDKNYTAVAEDIAGVVEAAEQLGARVKVILETCLLTDEEKAIACALSVLAGAAFVKTSTGFGKGGATPADVALMRFMVGTAAGVKASGGVRSAETLRAMVAAGATRIGTSGGVAIVSEFAELAGQWSEQSSKVEKNTVNGVGQVNRPSGQASQGEEY